MFYPLQLIIGAFSALVSTVKGNNHHHHHHHHRTDEQQVEILKKFEPIIREVIDEVLKRKDLIPVNWIDPKTQSSPPNTVRVLDYACGTGLVSVGLSPYVTSILGLDSSQVMVNAYNKAFREPNITAHLGNLLDPSTPSPPSLSTPEYYNFDLITCGHAFHHFPDPSLAAKRLSERLTPGGVLLMIDFLPHEGIEGNKEAAKKMEEHGVMHNGFSEEDTRRVFEEGGVAEGFGFEVVKRDVRFEGEGVEIKRSVFMAWGKKIRVRDEL